MDFIAAIEPIARELFGEPNLRLSNKGELRFGNHGSLSVDLTKGTWFDHETQEGGGALDLVGRGTGIAGQRERLTWCNEHGIEIETEGGNGAAHHPAKHIIKTYPYQDEDGHALFEVVRFEPKEFRQRRPDGNGGYIWSVRGIKQVPYRLPDLMEALAQDRPIFIVEGERDVDNLWQLSIPATCNAGGAGKWRPELSEYLQGADAIIIPDNDPQKTNPKTGELMFHENGSPVIPGHDHARAVARALDGIAGRIRILDLAKHWDTMPSKGDVSDFLRAGGTPERLFNLAEQTPDWSPTEEPQPPSLQQPLFPYVPIIFSAIPARFWLHARHYVCKHVVMTVAPGGFGKSSLLLCNALEMVTGRGLIGPAPVERVRCCYWNAEEPEIEEIHRRIAALCILHRIDPEDLRGELFLGPKISKDEWRFATVDRKGNIIRNEPLIKLITEYLGDNRISCLMLDPMVQFHKLPEIDTQAMEALIKDIMQPIAAQTHSCIEFSHHTRKPTQGGNTEITADDGRGAGAAAAAARSVRVLNRMSKEESQNANIGQEARKLYLRVSRDKSNMAPPTVAKWIQLINVDIGNGDNVQAVDEWRYPQPFDDVSVEDMHWMRDEVRRQSYRTSPRSPDWVGIPLCQHLGLSRDNPSDRTKLNAIIKKWFETGVLATETRKDEARRDREFVIPGSWRDEEAELLQPSLI